MPASASVKLKDFVIFCKSIQMYWFYFGSYAINNSLISRKLSGVNTSTEKQEKLWHFLFRILRTECGEKTAAFLRYAKIFGQEWTRYLPKVSCERLYRLSWCSLNINIWCFEYVENEISENLSLPKIITVLLSWDPSIFRP